MKKLCLLSAFIIILSYLQFAGAITTDMKDSYSPGETMIVGLSGNILEQIPSENVVFKRGHVAVPLEYDIKKLGDKTYLWAIAPLSEDNYTLNINGVVTTVAGNVQKIDYEKNFTVAGKVADYSVKPGFVLAKDDFDLTIRLNEDFDKTISVSFPVEQNILLKPGDNKLRFSIANVTGTQFITAVIGRYSVPIYIISNKTAAAQIITPVLEIIPTYIQRIISGLESYKIKIRNTGSERIENIQIFYNKDLFSITPQSEGINIESNDSFFFTIVVNNLTNIKEKIYINAPNVSIDLPVEINITENATSPLENASKGADAGYYCSELSGVICSSDESCTGQTQTSIDGLCCIGKCAAKPKASSSAWWGYLLIVLVLTGIIYLYIKYKKAKPKKNLLEKEITEKKKFS